ncbi:uncharacterized protein LOC127879143 isoform X2 [Dreissena polymorpha]|uniref:uncharacterized protein LOC127879143 isoform X2 n=1 Tax=Dreissena polymorpha TaxID=45954 RepID=UPI00226454F5|nr:uncharacterized protein LOC127879143 isoform X2 [Dreissena polymorpha]
MLSPGLGISCISNYSNLTSLPLRSKVKMAMCKQHRTAWNILRVTLSLFSMMAAKLIEQATVTVGLVLSFFQHPVQSTWTSCKATIFMDLLLTLYMDSNWNVSKTFPSWFRHKDAGLWCCLVVPVLLCSQGPLMSQLLVIASLLVYMWTFHTNWQADLTTVAIIVLYICGRVGYLVYNSFTVGEESITLSHILALCLYVTLLIKVPNQFPASFTFGEVAMTCQLYTVAWYMCVQAGQHFQAVEDHIRLGMVAFCGVHVFVAIVLLSRQLGLSPLAVWGILIVCGLTTAIITLHFLVNLTQLQVWMFSRTSVVMLAWWATLTVSSILVVALMGNVPSATTTTSDRDQLTKHIGQFDKLPDTSGQQIEASEYKEISKSISCKNSKVAVPSHTRNNVEVHKHSWRDTMSIQAHVSTVTRKYFHLMLLLVFIPGLMYTPRLLYVASALATGVIFIMEFIRYMLLPPMGELLHSYLSVFVDTQDKGQIILTPLYLILGCSLPLWCLPNTGNAHVSLFSGLLSIGVGDSAASIVGRKFGVHKWPGVTHSHLSLPLLLTIICNAVLESCTQQIDNLVVPVFTFMTLTSL